MSRSDPWITWLDALKLLERDEDYLRIGALAVMGRLARSNEDLREPTVQVLRSAVAEWSASGPHPTHAAGQAQELLTELGDEPST